MFVPKLPKPQTPSAEVATGSIMTHGSTRPLRHAPKEQRAFPEYSDGNCGKARSSGRGSTGLYGDGFAQQKDEKGPTAIRDASGFGWDFSSVPASRTGATSSPFAFMQRSPRGGPAHLQAIQQAAIENRTTTPPALADFAAAASHVRMRNDASADRSARLLGADAVAYGHQIFFREGRFQPHTERGSALIAHELTHVAHQRKSGRVRPQLRIAGDVLSVHYTRTMAQAMNDAELTQQMNILRAHLQENGGDAAAAENLAVLESVAYERQGSAKEAPAPAPGTQKPGEADSTAGMSTSDKLTKAYEYANIGAALRSELSQRFGPKQLVLMIAAGVTVFVAAQFTPVGWIADAGLVLTAAFIGKAMFDAIHHFAGFAAAANATTDQQLRQAGDEFAKAVAGLELDTIMLILTLLTGGAGGAAGRAASGASAPAGELALVGADGFIVGTIPAARAAETATAITTAQAAQLGLKGTALANAMLSKGGPKSTSEAVEDLGRKGGGADPNEAATVGTEIEPIEAQDWAAELKSQGYDTYTRKQFGSGQIGGRRLSSIFTDQRARPDLIAVNDANKTAIVGDITGNPASTTKIPGRIGQEEGLHIEKTIEYARQLKRQLGAGFRVFAQDRHWQTGTKTKLIEVF